MRAESDQSIFERGCLPEWTFEDCMNLVSADNGFWSVDAYYWFFPEEKCFMDLSRQFNQVYMRDMSCNPYDLSRGILLYKYCMPDDEYYSTYYNQEGCSQDFTVGTGKLQPDHVIFEPTGDGE